MKSKEVKTCGSGVIVVNSAGTSLCITVRVRAPQTGTVSAYCSPDQNITALTEGGFLMPERSRDHEQARSQSRQRQAQAYTIAFLCELENSL